jgi:hypothetical protein
VLKKKLYCYENYLPFLYFFRSRAICQRLLAWSTIIGWSTIVGLVNNRWLGQRSLAWSTIIGLVNNHWLVNNRWLVQQLLAIPPAVGNRYLHHVTPAVPRL